MSSPREQKYVTVARVYRARGNKGEVAAELLTDFPERLPQIKEMYLLSESGARRAVVLREFWADRNHRGSGVFHFAGVDSIDDAEKLRGLEVQIPFEQRAELPSGKYFVTDLIGCAVLELLSGTEAVVGKVRDVYFPGEGQPGTPLLSVNTPRGELLVPLAEDICRRIDVAAQRIEVELPDGLRELD